MERTTQHHICHQFGYEHFAARFWMTYLTFFLMCCYITERRMAEVFYPTFYKQFVDSADSADSIWRPPHFFGELGNTHFLLLDIFFYIYHARNKIISENPTWAWHVDIFGPHQRFSTILQRWNDQSSRKKSLDVGVRSHCRISRADNCLWSRKSFRGFGEDGSHRLLLVSKGVRK